MRLEKERDQKVHWNLDLSLWSIPKQKCTVHTYKISSNWLSLNKDLWANSGNRRLLKLRFHKQQNRKGSEPLLSNPSIYTARISKTSSKDLFLMVIVGKHMYLYAKVLLELHLGILVAFSSCISVLSNNFENIYVLLLYEDTVREM